MELEYYLMVRDVIKFVQLRRLRYYDLKSNYLKVY